VLGKDGNSDILSHLGSDNSLFDLLERKLFTHQVSEWVSGLGVGHEFHGADKVVAAIVMNTVNGPLAADDFF
jgi:hypothetical protein